MNEKTIFVQYLFIEMYVTSFSSISYYSYSEIDLKNVFWTNTPVLIKLWSQHLFGVVQDWYKTIFRIVVPEPYPQSNGGQNLGALEVLPSFQLLHVYCNWVMQAEEWSELKHDIPNKYWIGVRRSFLHRVIVLIG